jgi:hypothetical protein
MAQSAERVLRGELPHRDFDDPWTGGWSFFQAFVFQQMGLTLRAIRIPMFIAWLLGIVVAARIAARFVSATMSAVAAGACALWSLYAWHLPLLNWFYFPLALLSIWPVLRFEETSARGWLVLAGAAAGVAVLVKVTGLYVLAALLLWGVVWAGDREPSDRAEAASGFGWVATAFGVGFVVLVGLLLRQLPRTQYGAAALHFLTPCVATAALVAKRAWQGGRPLSVGVDRMWRVTWPIVLGFVLAIAPMLWCYAAAHALPALVAGVFIRPQGRMTLLSFGAPGRLATLAALVPPVLLFVGARFARVSTAARDLWLATLLGACMGAASHFDLPSAGSPLALSVRAMAIVLPLLALAWDHGKLMTGARGRGVVILVALTATSQLVQVPYGDFAYFLFVAPIAMLATFALVANAGGSSRAVLAFWAAFLLIAGLGRPMTAVLSNELSRAPLALERGGIEVTPLDSARLARLAEFMHHRPPGPVFTLGHAPELPFLLQRPSAGRAIYELLSEPADRDPQHTIEALNQQGVFTVIIQHTLMMGGPDSAQASMLRREFPLSVLLWPYEVRWRVPQPASAR